LPFEPFDRLAIGGGLDLGFRFLLAGIGPKVGAVLAFVEQPEQARSLVETGWDQAELGEEDRFDGARGLRRVGRVADVDPAVGVLFEDPLIRRTKGAVTCSR
jgi:hypothetical protein